MSQVPSVTRSLQPGVPPVLISVLVLLVALTTPLASSSARATHQNTAAQTTVMLFEAYERGDYAAVDAALKGIPRTPLSRVFKAEAARWVTSGAAEDRDRRRLVAASVALEILGAGLTFEWANISGLVEEACALMRQGPEGQAVEETWHLLGIALLQGGTAGGRTEPHARDHIRVHARGRVPNSSRLDLAWAIESEIAAAVNRRSWGIPSVGLDPPPTRDAIHAAKYPLGLYEALLDDPAVGFEAHVRLGHLLMQLHRHQEALPHFEAVRQSKDPYLRHLASFLAGNVHRRADAHAPAIEAYRQALIEWPGGISASLVLASQLSERGEWDDAHQVASAAAARQDAIDPWRLFVHAGYRLWPHWQAVLREQVRR